MHYAAISNVYFIFYRRAYSMFGINTLEYPLIQSSPGRRTEISLQEMLYNLF